MLKIGKFFNCGSRFTLKIQIFQKKHAYLVEITGNQSFAIFDEKGYLKLVECRTYYPKLIDILLFSKKIKIEIIQNERCIVKGFYDKGFYIFKKNKNLFIISRSPFKKKILDFKGIKISVKRKFFLSSTCYFQIEDDSLENIVLCTYAYLLWEDV